MAKLRGLIARDGGGKGTSGKWSKEPNPNSN